MTTDRIEALARHLVAARRDHVPAVIVPALVPASTAEAYAVQDRVSALLYGDVRPTAWKVGAPNAQAEPTAAPIQSTCVLTSPAHYLEPALEGLSIEAEIAFRVGQDVNGAGAQEPAQIFDRMLVSIEICDARIAEPDRAPAWLKLADFQVNAALVLGTGCDDWMACDLRTQRCVVACDGAIVFDARGGHPLGDPRGLLRWWLVHAAARGGVLAGDVVTTGSWCGMVPVRAGSTVDVRFEGIGAAQVRFDSEVPRSG